MPEKQKQQGYFYPKGTYNLKIIDHALSKKEKTGNTFVRFMVEVLSVDTKDKNYRPPVKPLEFGKKRFVDFFFTDKTRERTMDFLKGVGFTGDSIACLDEKAAAKLGKQFISLAGVEFRGPNDPQKGTDGFIYDKFGAWPINDGSAWKDKAVSANLGSLENLDNIWKKNLTGSGKTPASVTNAAKQEPQPSADEDFNDWNN